MSHESWMKAIRRKVPATWNLHRALRRHHRDDDLGVFSHNQFYH